jgi:hypothetical protein
MDSMTDLTVIAFDPGETTGWARLSVSASILAREPNGPTGYDHAPLHLCLTKVNYGEIDCRAVISDSAENEVHKHAGLNVYGESKGVVEMIGMFERESYSVAVIEDFVLDPRKATMGRDLLTPVRIISSFSYGMWCLGRDSDIFVQNRSPVKTTCTDDRLKRWGLYDRNSGPHARDAVRHGYYFLRNCRGDSGNARELRWRAWPNIFDDPIPTLKKSVANRRGSGVGERIPGL